MEKTIKLALYVCAIVSMILLVDCRIKETKLKAIKLATDCTVRTDISEKTTKKCIEKTLETADIEFIKE